MNQAHINWCKNLYESLRDGGTWGVPRSGLVFIKEEGAGLRLIEQMPFDPKMLISDEALSEYQDADFKAIREHFAAAGIPVLRDEG